MQRRGALAATNDLRKQGASEIMTASNHADAPRSGRFAYLAALWFGKAEVGQVAYVVSGVGLMACKYVVETLVVWTATGYVMRPWDFVNPMISERARLVQGAGDWLPWAWILWTLPLLFIAVSMSVRRAVDADRSPWLGMTVLVPLLNLPMMLALSLLPNRADESDAGGEDRSADLVRSGNMVTSIAMGLVAGSVMLVTSVYLLQDYGAALFLGTPLVMGAIASYLECRRHERAWSEAIGIGVATVGLAAVALLLFALEGVICIAMALPLIVPLGAIGGLFGKLMADISRKPTRGWVGAVLVLPLIAAGEASLSRNELRSVVSAIEIDAPPEVVWQNVLSFAELPRQREWFFRLGISCPERARIEGTGIGAVRYCEFTTGAFVEPITVWDEPRRLAFDVTEQPEPMFELSPYRHVHPPHLDGALRSERGEFRLVPLAGGRTRLEGRTWYRVDIHPQCYWCALSDVIIGRIHGRVLRHI